MTGRRQEDRIPPPPGKWGGVGELRGTPEGAGRRLAVVAARFNEVVTDALVSGAVEALRKHGVAAKDIRVIRVPGAWELPAACARVIRKGGVDGVIALGCVIRGDTPHFEYVCAEASRGLGAVARDSEVPVLFGVLTTDTFEQALLRAGEGDRNKGWEAAVAALEMISVYRALA